MLVFSNCYPTTVDAVALLTVIVIIRSTAATTTHLEYAPDYEHPEYAFSYGVKDLYTGDVKSQWESRDNGRIKGHYSVLEPDGSIRSVDYTADAKHGFNAVVKTHGPNMHPIMESLNPVSPHVNHEPSQSKINHYSKNQNRIILGSNLELEEEFKAQKPSTELKKPIEKDIIYGQKGKLAPKSAQLYPSPKLIPEIKSILASNSSAPKIPDTLSSYQDNQEPWLAIAGNDAVRYHEAFEEAEEHEKGVDAPIHILPVSLPYSRVVSSLNTSFISSKPVFNDKANSSFARPEKVRVKVFTTPELRHYAGLGRPKKVKHSHKQNFFSGTFPRRGKTMNQQRGRPV